MMALPRPFKEDCRALPLNREGGCMAFTANEVAYVGNWNTYQYSSMVLADFPYERRVIFGNKYPSYIDMNGYIKGRDG